MPVPKPKKNLLTSLLSDAADDTARGSARSGGNALLDRLQSGVRTTVSKRTGLNLNRLPTLRLRRKDSGWLDPDKARAHKAVKDWWRKAKRQGPRVVLRPAAYRDDVEAVLRDLGAIKTALDSAADGMDTQSIARAYHYVASVMYRDAIRASDKQPVDEVVVGRDADTFGVLAVYVLTVRGVRITAPAAAFAKLARSYVGRLRAKAEALPRAVNLPAQQEPSRTPAPPPPPVQQEGGGGGAVLAVIGILAVVGVIVAARK